ncbi:FtsK/SpoIIIE domain-containing protein [Kitasatospora acidiphila]|uniref:FtsK/SpoIIIE domain-containing protein n=1 Tax=Kitasatospora acidiphila TaxID=2567942 RepID=UPI003C754826
MDTLAELTARHSALSGLLRAAATPAPTGHPTGPAQPGQGAGTPAWINAIGRGFWAAIEWLAHVTHTSALAVLVVLGGIGWAVQQMPPGTFKRKPKPGAVTSEARSEAIGEATGKAGRALWRLLSGRPVGAKQAEKKQAAGGRWRTPTAVAPQTRPLPERPEVEFGSVALPAAPFSQLSAPFGLDDKLVAFQDWLYDSVVGLAPRVLLRLIDWSALAVVWLAVLVRWSGRPARGVVMLPVSVWRSAMTYQRWAYWQVLALRVAVAAGTAAYFLAPGQLPAAGSWALGGLVVLGAGGPQGLGLWHPARPTADQVYGQALWQMFHSVLGLPPEAKKSDWLHVPERLEEEGAQVVLMLPETFLGAPRERAGLDEIVDVRLPGRWVSEWRLQGGGHKATWTLVPEREIRDLVGDEAAYGPALWEALRAGLKLPAEDLLWDWLTIPAELAAEDARVRIELPMAFVGTEGERASLDALVNSRLPGEWVSTWQLMGEEHFATWRHKPKPKPAPEPPTGVDFLSEQVQKILHGLQPGELLVGMDAFGRPLIKKLAGETSHWALSIGSGGGKSAFLYMLIAQLVRQKATVVVPDVKMVSLDYYEGAAGIHIYNDPENVQDMRKAIDWVKEETKARTFIMKKNKSRRFDPLVLILEEGNEFGEISKEWWADNKPDGAKAGDPVWGDVASIMRLGRHVNVHVIAVFQDLDERVFGNKGLRTLFNLILMGSYTPQQWRKIIARSPIPESPRKAGRIIAVEGAAEEAFQSPWTEEPNFRTYIDGWRRITGFTEGSDLFGRPPTRSTVDVPGLLVGTEYAQQDDRHDVTPQDTATPETALGAAAGSIIPGQRVTLVKGDAPRDSQGDGLRDALLRALEPYGTEAPAEPAEELLSLAAISRKFEEMGVNRPSNTMSAHKRRYPDFPQGTEEKGKKKYRFSEIQAFYEARENVEAAARMTDS